MPSEGEGVYFVGAVHSVVSPKGDAHLEPLNHLNYRFTSLLLSQPLQFRAGSVGFIEV